MPIADNISCKVVHARKRSTSNVFTHLIGFMYMTLDNDILKNKNFICPRNHNLAVVTIIDISYIHARK